MTLGWGYLITVAILKLFKVSMILLLFGLHKAPQRRSCNFQMSPASIHAADLLFILQPGNKI
jgi:hypothetical protein